MKEIKLKITNTGQIAYLKLKGYRYETTSVNRYGGNKRIEYYFYVPEDNKNIIQDYFQSEFNKYKRELDLTRQEIETLKNN